LARMSVAPRTLVIAIAGIVVPLILLALALAA
jgi:hypothetical protein